MTANHPIFEDRAEAPISRLSRPRRSITHSVAQFAITFALLWVAFFGLYSAVPYIRAGSGIIFAAKLDRELHGKVFSTGSDETRLIIFGNSKVLAGFVSRQFDHVASSSGRRTISFNSGYPGNSSFVPELSQIAANGQSPDVVLLTAPWAPRPAKSDIFHFVSEDHAVAEQLFPFRHLLRDAFSFAVTARQHGGIRKFYEESRGNVEKMLNDRGYYFISEQSHFPNEALPSDFHLPSDTPNEVYQRIADLKSPQLAELAKVLNDHRIVCYFVPSYSRVGEFAPAPSRNQLFASQVEAVLPCRVLGPDYFLLPNSDFSDQIHLNHAGAAAYTNALYRLVAPNLSAAR